MFDREWGRSSFARPQPNSDNRSNGADIRR